MAPFLVGIFKSEEDPLKQCSNENNFVREIDVNSNFAFEGDFFEDLDTDIIPPYLIVGCFVICAGVFTTICAYMKQVFFMVVISEYLSSTLD